MQRDYFNCPRFKNKSLCLCSVVHYLLKKYLPLVGQSKTKAQRSAFHGRRALPGSSAVLVEARPSLVRRGGRVAAIPGTQSEPGSPQGSLAGLPSSQTQTLPVAGSHTPL